MRKLLLLLVVNFLLFCFCHNTSAQAWKKVVPLVSNCEQLKDILPIKDCNVLYSRLDTPEYDVTIFYSKRTCQEGGQWNIPKGIVTDILFTLKPFMRLSAYDGNLKDYVVKLEDDIADSKIYTNDKLGIQLSIHIDKTYGELIQDIYLYPSAENESKFRCGTQVAKETSCPKKNQ